MMKTLQVYALMFAAATAVACGRTDAVPATGVAASTTVPGWKLGPALSVGGPEADENQILFSVSGVTEDHSGGFHVLNFGDKRLLAFDAQGRFVHESGGEGNGPGEFMAPLSLAAAGGELFVLDSQANRISRFRESDGRFVSTVPVQDAPGSPIEIQADSAGSLLLRFEPSPLTTPGVSAPRPLVARVSATGGRPEPIVRLDSMPIMQLEGRTPRGIVTRFMPRPFAPRSVWSVASDGTVYYGSGAAFEVFRTRGGTPVPAFREAREPDVVTERDRRSYLEGNPFASDGRKIPFPRTKPHFTGLEVDPHGLVWIQVLQSDTGVSWEIRDSTGKPLGEVRLPPRSRLMEVSRTALYVVQRDEEDVETLHRIPLARTAN